MNVLYDMETQDPDDLFALAILASHPKVNLRGVGITPGSMKQVGLIKKALEMLGYSDMPIGAFNTDHPKDCISPWWTSFIGDEPKHMAIEAVYMYNDLITSYPDLTIITGAPLKNLGRFLGEYDGVRINRWIGQGGFAGDNIVPEHLRLDKFKGMTTCPTFNFNGDPKSALLALNYPDMDERRLVSKNVCHGFVYDQEMHERMAPYRDKNPALKMVYDGMTSYLRKRPEGKKFHDPLAVCVAINPDIAEFRQVEIFREKGQWGSKPSETSNTWISIQADKDKFFETMIS